MAMKSIAEARERAKTHFQERHMRTYFAHFLFAIFIFAGSTKSRAVQILIDETRSIDTDEKTLSELQELQLKYPKVHAEIEAAIANLDFRKHVNAVYFYPPFNYNNELFYQIYFYKLSHEALAKVIAAAKAARDELEGYQREVYDEAIRRFELRQNARVEVEAVAGGAKREGEDAKPRKKQNRAPRKRKKITQPQEQENNIVVEAPEFEMPPPDVMPFIVQPIFFDLSGLPDFLQ